MNTIILHTFFRLFADGLDTDPLPKPGGAGKDAGTAAIDIILPMVFGTIGAIALLTIVISGFRYIAAAGDPQKISTAKKGILYALVGLVVALSGYSIVIFVIQGVG